MGDKQTFETVLIRHPGMEATGIKIPFDVKEVFGSKRVPVKATINETEYRGSIVTMGGEFCLGIPKAIRERANIIAGDHIVVTIERDTDERIVDIPTDLASGLAKRGLTEVWNAMSYTNRKEQARAIVEAKQPATRLRRIEMAVAMTLAKKNSKDVRP